MVRRVILAQGENKVESLRLRNVKTDEVSELKTDGTFIYVGLLPNTEAFLNLGISDDEGWILTDEYMQTAIPGIYAIGDVRQTVLRQVATAVGDGSIAGDQVYKYIESKKSQAVK